MKRIFLFLMEEIQRCRFRSYGDAVSIDATTRLLRKFQIRFYTYRERRRYVTIGKECLLNASLTFEASNGSIVIGDRCYIGVGTSIISRDAVLIGNDVTMAWGVTIYDHNSHSTDWKQRAKVVKHFYELYGTEKCFRELDWTGVKAAQIKICNKVWIGFDAVILKGVTIGEGAIVGARSVVTKDVEPYTIVAGNPAAVIGKVSDVSPK